jgi:heat shock protein HslJ
VRVAFALAVGIGLVGMQGCSRSSPEGTSPMPSPVGVEWRLVSIGGTAVGTGANGQPATLRLDETSGRASGYAGCNQFSGSYTLSGSSISFGPLAITRMACAQDGELESRYTMALGQVTGWKMTSTGLDLRRGSTLLAKFTK